jgi:hypothetical protein
MRTLLRIVVMLVVTLLVMWCSAQLFGVPGVVPSLFAGALVGLWVQGKAIPAAQPKPTRRG